MCIVFLRLREHFQVLYFVFVYSQFKYITIFFKPSKYLFQFSFLILLVVLRHLQKQCICISLHKTYKLYVIPSFYCKCRSEYIHSMLQLHISTKYAHSKYDTSSFKLLSAATITRKKSAKALSACTPQAFHCLIITAIKRKKILICSSKLLNSWLNKTLKETTYRITQSLKLP